MKFKVQRDYIVKRNQRGKIYKPYGRSKDRLLKDIECEFYEYEMIRKGVWKDDERWQVDGYCKELGGVDVKCIKRYYNISRQKLLYLLKQKGHTNTFFFIEWKERPERLLKTGDTIEFNRLGPIGYGTLIDNVKVSFKGDGYYVDVRKLLRS